VCFSSVTGCSSGIGKALAEFVATDPAQKVIVTARNAGSLSYLADGPNVLKLALDVDSPDSVNEAFSQAASHFGHIDVLVNNAGFSLSGDTENVTENDMRAEMETNFFGSVRCSIKAVENMRKHTAGRGGIIYQISSLAGVCAFPGHSFYHASKWAIEGWTESFAREMSPKWNSRYPNSIPSFTIQI
jgi:NAD(P)-dependent dehydrogenase (short-subunit alcohol dehydrogenase family)